MLLVAVAVVLPLAAGCTKMLAEEGTLTVRLEEAATLNVGNYYVYRTSSGEIGSWRAAQVRRGQDVVVTYSFKDMPH